MFFTSRAFWIPKDVRSAEQYEDAFVVDDQRGIAAIADGVSSSFSAATWAQLLVRQAVDAPPNIYDKAAVHTWLTSLRVAWKENIDVGSLAWHQKAKMESGACATLLSTWFDFAEASDPNATAPIRMHAYAVGDCCLFHVRGGQVLRAFPIEDSHVFAQNPRTVDSIDRGQDDQLALTILTDYCAEGDLIVLCSDALAAWALVELESGRSPCWEQFWEMPQETWGLWVSELRQNGDIRFDDSTLVLLRIGSGVEISEEMSASGTILDDVKKAADDMKKTITGSSAWGWVEETVTGKKNRNKNR